MTFDKKIAEDKAFDTIFGGEEDNHLLDLVLKEDAETFGKDVRDTDGVEDGLGAIGSGKGLGNDLGPDKDVIKPTDDSSDEKVLVNTDKNLKSNDQLNISDTTGQKVQDGVTVDPKDAKTYGTDELVGNDPAICDRHISDAMGKEANSTDSFDEAMSLLLSEAEDDANIPEEEDDPGDVKEGCAGKDCADGKKVVKEEDVPVEPAPTQAPPAVEEPVPAAPAADVPVATPAAPSDADDDLSLLDTDVPNTSDVPTPPEVPAEPEEAPTTIDDLEAESEAVDTVDPKDVNDPVDPSKIENGTGKIGAGDGHGSDLGPGNDAIKPADDTSDEKVIPAKDMELKNDQLNTSDTAGNGKVVDGTTVKNGDFLNAGEDRKAADDSFKEATVEDLERASEEEEDAIIDAVEGNKEKSDFTPSELNADDDDEILAMLN